MGRGFIYVLEGTERGEERLDGGKKKEKKKRTRADQNNQTKEKQNKQEIKKIAMRGRSGPHICLHSL